jgi:ABC-type amino acid transport substrate-binding protein
MQFGEPGTDSYRGFEVDLMHALSEHLEVQLHYRRAPWSSLLSELKAGTIDFICGAATITAQRGTEVSFSRPYLPISLAVVSKRPVLADRLREIARIGVREATTAQEYLRSLEIEAARTSESNDELYELLANDSLDAVLDDSPIAHEFARRVPGSQVITVPATEGAYALVVRKENHQLLSAVNALVARMDADGTLHRLRRRWRLPRGWPCAAGGPMSRHRSASERMAVFLRGISHVRMAALISRLQHLDLGEVDSFGMSGNLIVSAQHAAIEPLERALGSPSRPAVKAFPTST